MANEPMLLDLNDWAVDQVLWLPGQSGNYASIPDVNRLWSSTVTLEQDQGQWVTSSWQTNGERSQDVTPYLGNYLWKVTTNIDSGAENHLVRIDGETNDSIPVVAGNTYTWSVYIYSPDVTRDMGPIIRWYDSTGTSLSSSVGPQTTTILGEWTQISMTEVAPANATHVYLDISFNTGGVADEVHYFDGAMFMEGSDPTFLPSTRIVGDIDIVGKLAMQNWSDRNGGVVAKRVSTATNAYTFRTTSTDKLELFWTDQTDTQINAVSTEALSIPAHVEAYVRATLDVDNGAGGYEVNFYFSYDGADWIQLGDTIVGGATTNIRPTIAAIEIGQTGGGDGPQRGAIFNIEVRDGIEGVTITSVDFTDTTQAVGDTFTSPEGHQVTINRSGDATAELVQQNYWTFTGSEQLKFPDRVELDINDVSSEQFIGFISRASGTSNRLIIKDTGTNGWALSMGDPGSGRLRFYTRETNTISLDTTSAFNDGIKKVASIYLDSAGVIKRIYVDDNLEAEHTTGGAILDNSQWYGVGAGGSPLYYSKSLIQFIVTFKRLLTDLERSEIHNWDGTIANEPTWIRDEAVLYVNADDPAQARQYRADYGVLNLAYDVADDVPDTLYVRETLTTEDSTVTPSIDDFYIEVYPAVRDVEDEINPIEGTGYGGLKYAEEPALFRASGQSIRFDGKDDYVDASHVTYDGPPVSMELWVKGGYQDDAYARLLDNNGYSTSNGGWDIETSSNGPSIALRIDSDTTSPNTGIQIPNVLDNHWHHIVYVISGNDVYGYKDGELVVTSTWNGNDISNDIGLFIGGRSIITDFFDGLIDDVAIYDYVLEASEVAQHYNIGWRGKYSLRQDGDFVTIGADEVDADDYAWSIVKG